MNKPPCNCNVSTGIHDGLTFGKGTLDAHGFWEFPCFECARAAEIRDQEPEGTYWPWDKKAAAETTSMEINILNKVSCHLNDAEYEFLKQALAVDTPDQARKDRKLTNIVLKPRFRKFFTSKTKNEEIIGKEFKVICKSTAANDLWVIEIENERIFAYEEEICFIDYNKSN
jgi:hypothetical protein